jgi:hypothetical protein
MASRMDLESIEPPIEWAPGIQSPRLKRQGLEAHSLLPIGEVMMVKLYLNSVIRIHGIVFNYITKYRDNLGTLIS